MKTKLFKLFCWSYIIMGLFHEIIVIIQHSSIPPDNIQVVLDSMKEIKIFNSSFYHFFVGYDFLIGIYFFIYGYSNLFLARELKEKLFNKASYHCIIAIVNGLSLYLAITYFFFLPIIFTAFALISHSLSFILKEYS